MKKFTRASSRSDEKKDTIKAIETLKNSLKTLYRKLELASEVYHIRALKTRIKKEQKQVSKFEKLLESHTAQDWGFNNLQ